jgi:hypothetical protein
MKATKGETQPPEDASRGSVRVGFISPEEATRAAQAIEPDNEGYLVIRIEGRTLVLEASGDRLSVLRTIDDALACLRALQDPETG